MSGKKRKKVEQLWPRLVRRGHHLGPEAEDFAQDACVKMLEGKSQHQTIDQMFVDYLRATGGRKGLPGYSQRQNFKHVDNIESPALENSLATDPRQSLECRIDFDRIAGRLRGWKRCLLLMRYQDGLNEKEIAHYFGLTESWVSLSLKGIQSGLSARIAQEERRSLSRQGAGQMAVVVSTQTIGGPGLERGTDQGMATLQSWSMESLNEASF
jgi:DNA-directed RNA polymerase specialized sigma24 family protein